MDIGLIVSFAGVTVATLAGVLGVWMERDPDSPKRWAFVFSGFILASSGVELVNTMESTAESAKTDAKLATVLLAMSDLAAKGGNPALEQFVGAELAVQARANPQLVKKMEKEIQAKGGDPTTVTKRAAEGRRLASGLPAAKPAPGERPRLAGAGEAGAGRAKAGFGGGVAGAGARMAGEGAGPGAGLGGGVGGAMGKAGQAAGQAEAAVGKAGKAADAAAKAVSGATGGAVDATKAVGAATATATKATETATKATETATKATETATKATEDAKKQADDAKKKADEAKKKAEDSKKKADETKDKATEALKGLGG